MANLTTNRSAKFARRREAHKAQREANKKLMAERVPLPPQEQLKRLDWRLGKGQGAKRERARLKERLQEAKA